MYILIEQLTPEDEDRRKRRRERNKIAATKCRLKKRERTQNLVSEADILDTQNLDMKKQMQSLNIERQALTKMLQAHSSTCISQEAIQVPNLSTNIIKFLNNMISDIANHTPITAGLKESCDPLKTKISIKIAQPPKTTKIPSVNTLKFGMKRGQQRLHTTNQVPMEALATTTNTTACLRTPIHIPSNIDQKPLPSMDISFSDSGNSDILTPIYCPTSNDCFTINSPDSGFIKSPVDISGNYTNLQTTIIKTDYIPNCEHNGLTLVHGLGNGTDSNNADSTMEFILKHEIADGNDNPYTTDQSADRFLCDGATETFDSELETSVTNSNHLQDNTNMVMNSIQHIAPLKEHLLIQNNNNSSNQNHNIQSNIINSNCNGTIVSSPAITTHSIELNQACQQLVDMRGDFLSPNGDFFFTSENCDTQFTDLDSGVTTYTNVTNGGGCLA